MPFNLGGPELLIVLVVILIVFGAGKIPNVMKDIGSGMREFRKAQTEPEAGPVASMHASTDTPAETVAPATTAAGDGHAPATPAAGHVTAAPRA